MKHRILISTCLIGLICLIAVTIGRAVCPTPPRTAGTRAMTLAKVPTKQETVVLLHGLCRTSRSMAKMEKALTAEGYRVINVDYPSRSATIEELSEQVFQTLEATALRHSSSFPESGKIHFVTHSLGGVLLRHYLDKHNIADSTTPRSLEGQRPRCPDAGDGVPPQKIMTCNGTLSARLGRVVMLAPPSRGSEVTDKLGHIKLYQWINGPAGNQLGTNGHPLRLKAPGFELGIIAGDRTINPILSMLIPGPDDGKVSLARVKPAAYTDYLKLHVTHACMMRNRQVINQTIAFLKDGAFNKADAPPDQAKKRTQLSEKT